MAGRVPVLGLDDIVEAAGQRVHGLKDLVGPGNGKAATGEKIILHVYDDENVVDAETLGQGSVY